MSNSHLRVNTGSGKTAPLRNVALFHELVVRLVDRSQHLPGWLSYAHIFSCDFEAVMIP